MSATPADPLDARAYQSRLAGLAAIKDADWIARQRSRSVAERIEAGSALRDWAHIAHPDLDWARLRDEDIESHARVAALMRRADDGFAR